MDHQYKLYIIHRFHAKLVVKMVQYKYFASHTETVNNHHAKYLKPLCTINSWAKHKNVCLLLADQHSKIGAEPKFCIAVVTIFFFSVLHLR